MIRCYRQDPTGIYPVGEKEYEALPQFVKDTLNEGMLAVDMPNMYGNTEAHLTHENVVFPDC